MLLPLYAVDHNPNKVGMLPGVHRPTIANAAAVSTTLATAPCNLYPLEVLLLEKNFSSIMQRNGNHTANYFSHTLPVCPLPAGTPVMGRQTPDRAAIHVDT